MFTVSSFLLYFFGNFFLIRFDDLVIAIELLRTSEATHHVLAWWIPSYYYLHDC